MNTPSKYRTIVKELPSCSRCDGVTMKEGYNGAPFCPSCGTTGFLARHLHDAPQPAYAEVSEALVWESAVDNLQTALTGFIAQRDALRRQVMSLRSEVIDLRRDADLTAQAHQLDLSAEASDGFDAGYDAAMVTLATWLREYHALGRPNRFAEKIAAELFWYHDGRTS